LAIVAFPPIEQADENGLLAFGGDMEISSLRLAYQGGIFPWPIGPGYPLAWFSPNPRGILFFDDLHLSRSLKKYIKQQHFSITFNRAFKEVITNCALTSNRKIKGSTSHDTWITPEIIKAYINFHHAGHAYSVEVWQDDLLVGGLYGVRIGQAVSGESMFFNVDNASKIALAALMVYLKQNQITWLDTQMVTQVVATMGGKEIDRKNFIELLNKSSPLDGDHLFNSKLFFDAKHLLGQTTK